jgi:hypothetical protein
MRGIIEKGNCVFRYRLVYQEWQKEEKELYDLFISVYGDSPLCNHISPKGDIRQMDTGDIRKLKLRAEAEKGSRYNGEERKQYRMAGTKAREETPA